MKLIHLRWFCEADLWSWFKLIQVVKLPNALKVIASNHTERPAWPCRTSRPALRTYWPPATAYKAVDNVWSIRSGSLSSGNAISWTFQTTSEQWPFGDPCNTPHSIHVIPLTRISLIRVIPFTRVIPSILFSCLALTNLLEPTIIRLCPGCPRSPGWLGHHSIHSIQLACFVLHSCLWCNLWSSLPNGFTINSPTSVDLQWRFSTVLQHVNMVSGHWHQQKHLDKTFFMINASFLSFCSPFKFLRWNVWTLKLIFGLLSPL